MTWQRLTLLICVAFFVVTATACGGTSVITTNRGPVKEVPKDDEEPPPPVPDPDLPVDFEFISDPEMIVSDARWTVPAVGDGNGVLQWKIPYDDCRPADMIVYIVRIWIWGGDGPFNEDEAVEVITTNLSLFNINQNDEDSNGNPALGLSVPFSLLFTGDETFSVRSELNVTPEVEDCYFLEDEGSQISWNVVIRFD